MPVRRQVSETVEIRYKIALIGFTIAAFLFITGALADAQEVGDLDRRGRVTNALVTFGPMGKTRTVEVEFVIQGGRTVTARTARFTADVDRGDRLRIVYDPQRPDRIQEAGWGTDYTASIGFALGGVVTTALAVGCLLRRWPRRLERPFFT